MKNNIVWKIASFSVLVVLIFHTIIMNFVVPVVPISPKLSIIISVLSSTAIYAVLFKVLIFIYSKYLWKLFAANINIQGSWSAVIFDENGEAIRKGEFFIEQDFEKIIINCKNFDYSNEKKITVIWKSEQAWIEDLTLHFTYSARSLIKGVPNKNGHSVMQLDGNAPPMEMTGVYYSDQKGRITLERN